jgi:uncharacterized membrane protein SpoIIM required for sporulation
MPSTEDKQRERWHHISRLLERVERRGIESLSCDEVKDLCRLYRHVTIDLSKARAAGDDPELVRYLNSLAARAHGHVYRTRKVSLKPLGSFVATGFPSLVRRRWVPICIAVGIFLLSSFASFLAVVREPELAYSLFNEDIVEYENVRLERHEGEYRGNFTFDVQQSPFIAVAIIGNNIKVSIFAFAFGAICCLPGLLLLVMNGRMLGTLTGLVWIHGFFVDFYSLILTHGVLELTAICISAGSGLMLGWAVIAPGRLSRAQSLRQVAGDAFGLLAGCALLLIIAGHIEAYVTPHAPALVRWGVAILSAMFLAGYLGFAGRRGRGSQQSAERELEIPIHEGGRQSAGLDVENMNAQPA